MGEVRDLLYWLWEDGRLCRYAGLLCAVA